MPSLRDLISQKKAILWDFDGCFADTERIHFLAYQEAFRKFGHEVNEKEYYGRFTFFGLGTAAEIETYGLQCNVNQIAELKLAAYLRLLREGEVHVFPGVVKILNHLKKQGIRSAIASNSTLEEIDLVLQKNPDAAKLLDAVVGKTPHLKKKPAPDIFQFAMNELDVSATQTLVVEDSNRGLVAAHAAGCDAIWILTKFNESFSTDAPHVAALSHAEMLSTLLE